MSPYPSSGKVSYYTDQSVDPRWGGITRSGEKFDETKPTAAVLPEHWKELKGKTIRVTNPENNKSVDVKVTDTGGFGKYKRVLDLSKSAFQSIADPKQGVGNFKIEVLEPIITPPPVKTTPPVTKPRAQLDLNPFSITEAQAAESTETVSVNPAFQRVQELWQQPNPSVDRVQQLWQETPEPTNPIKENLKKVFGKPLTLQEAAEATYRSPFVETEEFGALGVLKPVIPGVQEPAKIFWQQLDRPRGVLANLTAGKSLIEGFNKPETANWNHFTEPALDFWGFKPDTASRQVAGNLMNFGMDILAWNLIYNIIPSAVKAEYTAKQGSAAEKLTNVLANEFKAAGLSDADALQAGKIYVAQKWPKLGVMQKSPWEIKRAINILEQNPGRLGKQMRTYADYAKQQAEMRGFTTDWFRQAVEGKPMLPPPESGIGIETIPTVAEKPIAAPGISETPKKAIPEVPAGITEIKKPLQRVSISFSEEDKGILAKIKEEVTGAQPGHRYVTRDEQREFVHAGYEPSDYSYIPYWPKGWGKDVLKVIDTALKTGKLTQLQSEKIGILLDTYKEVTNEQTRLEKELIAEGIEQSEINAAKRLGEEEAAGIVESESVSTKDLFGIEKTPPTVAASIKELPVEQQPISLAPLKTGIEKQVIIPGTEPKFVAPKPQQDLRRALNLLDTSMEAQNVFEKLGFNKKEILFVIDKVEAGAILDTDEQHIYDTFSNLNQDILKKEIAKYEQATSKEAIRQLTERTKTAGIEYAGGITQPQAERAVSYGQAHGKDEIRIESTRANKTSVRQLFNEGKLTLEQLNNQIEQALNTKRSWLKTVVEQDTALSRDDIKQNLFLKVWDAKDWKKQTVDFALKNLLSEESSPDKNRYTNDQVIQYKKLVDSITAENREPTTEEIAKRIRVNGKPGISIERAKFIEWMANLKKISLDALTAEGVQFPATVPGIEETNINTTVRDIILSSKSMAEAQARLKKELDLDFSIADLKNLEIQVKGGAPLDLANRIIDDLMKKILQEKDADIKYGFTKILGADAGELTEGISIGEKAKELTLDTFRKLKHAINALELAQNYLYSFPDSKPIAEGIIDANTKLLKRLFDLEQFYAIANNVRNNENLAKILVDADRDNSKNIFVELRNAVKAGGLTQQDYDAFSKGLYFIRKFIKDSLIEDILDSRIGVRLKSNGKRYLIRYTRKDGQITQRLVTGIQLDTLKERFGDLKILDEKESITLKHLDPETGEYKIKTALVKDYMEAVALQDEQTQALIKQLLPFENWISHARRGGNWWVEIYEPLVSGEKETKVYSARVQSEAYANKMAEVAKARFPSARITVHPHSRKMQEIPSLGTMADVQFFLNQKGIDPKSEAGQRILNTYRAMSPLLSSLIHSQNIAGYRTDYAGIVDNMYLMAKSAARRKFRLELKDLRELLKGIQDDFRYNAAYKYLEALTTTGEGHPFLDGTKALTYFLLLANKPTYIVQNLSEPLWGLTAAIPQMKNPFSLVKPLNKEFTTLMKKAEKEGLLKPFFMEDFGGEGKLGKLDYLGRASERFSSRKVFEIGLKVARDKGLKGEEAYMAAYQFLFNEGKPFYNQANKPIETLGPGWQVFRKYGFILMNWMLWWTNQLFRGSLQKKILMILAAHMLSGINTIPFAKRILKKTGWINLNKNPRDLTFAERYVLAGLPGATLNMSTRFLAPVFQKGFTEGIELLRSVNILVNKIQQANTAYKNYGLVGIAASLPLAGLQYPLMGKIISEKGLKRSRRVIYRPRTLREKILLQEGFTPLEMEQARER